MKRRKIKDLQEPAKTRGISMERRLFLYWLIMVLAVMTAVFVVLIVAGVFSNDAGKLGGTLSVQQKNTTMTFNKLIDTLNAQNLALSEQITREVSDVLETEERTFKDLDNNPELITRIEERMCFYLQTIVRSRSCSGVYFTLDATTNTAAPGAERSRMGLYLRSGNVGTDGMANPYITFFRGVADVARKENIQMHNRWNLEFDIDQIPGCQELMNTPLERPAERYFWSRRINLKDTWESAMLLCVPIVGSDGTVYGVCGVEISGLYFQFSYPTVETQFGSAVTVLAPVQDNRLLLSDGLTGSVNGTYLDGLETLLIHQGRYYNEYDAGAEQYIGLHQNLLISKGEIEDDIWVVAIMIPQNSYTAYTVDKQKTWIMIALMLFLVLLSLAFFLTRKFVRPITDSLKRFQQEETLEPGVFSGISEVDELAEFLNARARSQRLEQGELPPNIAELFDQFIERKCLLTEAERNILRYYIDGYEIADIPELAFISMSTVRKHNRKIYEKLGVSSRDELMLYIDLIRRCGRLQELF